jgi:23S rRNA U2552 (ribose-2'-O)-methylase RlmE/FtsJ
MKRGSTMNSSTQQSSLGSAGLPSRYRQFVEAVKRVNQRIAPGLYKSLRFRWGHPARMAQIAKVVSGSSLSQVQSGPFSGMLCSNAVTGNSIPKMLGVYELELHDIVQQIIQHGYRLVVDIGCGEGYYLVGLALRLPAARLIGYDIDPLAQSACAEQARLNHVSDRVTIDGKCDTVELQRILEPGSLVISDCEGHEADLFQPDLAPALSRCDLLIELHEMFSPGVTETLVKRFQPTHDIELIDSAERDPKLYPVLNTLSPKQQRLAVNEDRYAAMQWAWMRAKTR